MPGIPPTPDIFDDPSISICLNSEWASFIEARAGQLLSRSLWEGTDSEIDRAIEQISLFLTKLGEIGACALTPVGAIMMHGAAAAPAGWLICDGAAVSRTTYADLFAVIGTSWGPGNGTTTFNLPNMIDRLPMGSGGAVVPAISNTAGSLTHTLTTAELPAHNHGVSDPGHNHAVADPGHAHTSLVRGSGTAGGTLNRMNAPTQTTTSSNWTTDSGPTGISIGTNTTGISTNNAGGGGSHSILNPVTGVPFIIFAGV